jgi:hypothetical protein
MKRTTYASVLGVIGVAAAAVLLLRGPAETQPIIPEKKVQGSTVIRVHKSLGLSPPVLRVRPGHTVIWLNESGGLVEIVFTGRQITLACDSPVNFIVDIDGTFVSNKIPVGAVASLCLLEKGEFEYRVVWASKTVAGMPSEDAFVGKIIVEKDA